jgi:hypothetical protein
MNAPETTEHRRLRFVLPYEVHDKDTGAVDRTRIFLGCAEAPRAPIEKLEFSRAEVFDLKRSITDHEPPADEMLVVEWPLDGQVVDLCLIMEDCEPLLGLLENWLERTR